jgi:hypothetical protein
MRKREEKIDINTSFSGTPDLCGRHFKKII